jgi:hypothetical protein
MSEDPTAATAAAINAAMQARREAALATSRLLHPAFRQVEAEAVREADRERRAQQPPPRDVLRAAHARQVEAEGEAERLGEAAERAREHRGIVAKRRDDIARTIAAEDKAAADRLIAELTGGAGAQLASDRGEGSAALVAAERELAVAARAGAQLEEQLAEVQGKRTIAAGDVRRAACALLLQHAETQAERLQAMERAALDERDALHALTRVITDTQRAETVRRAWPAHIGQAIHPLEPPRAARATAEGLARWRETLAELMRDPETHPDLDGA